MERCRAEIGTGTAEPVDDQDVATLLEQLQQKVRCGICVEPISAFDMFVMWPLGGVVAHMACYVQGRALPRVEASS